MINKLFHKPELSFEENRIYKIFNVIVLGAFFVVSIISISLYLSDQIIPFLLSIIELLSFVLIIRWHTKGHYHVPRFIFFIITNFMNMYGSFYNGEGGGYDFLFFAIGLCSILFFKKRIYYTIIILLSTSSLIFVKYFYAYIPPKLLLEVNIFPYYWNIFVTFFLIYLSLDLFKSMHLDYERRLKEGKENTKKRNDSLVDIQIKLEALLNAKDQKIKEQMENINYYAYLNSHKVRSPLARILGLINLAEMNTLNDQEKKEFFLRKIKDNAEDLDKVLNEINTLLNENIGHRN